MSNVRISYGALRRLISETISSAGINVPKSLDMIELQALYPIAARAAVDQGLGNDSAFSLEDRHADPGAAGWIEMNDEFDGVNKFVRLRVRGPDGETLTFDGTRWT